MPDDLKGPRVGLLRAGHAHLRINEDRGGRWEEYVNDTVIRES